MSGEHTGGMAEAVLVLTHRGDREGPVGLAAHAISVLAPERRGRDSNPRWTEPPIPVFETGAFNRSATSPVGGRD